MMHAPPLPLVRDLVLIGGGHAHALVLRQWAMDPLPGARVTLINPGPVAPYTGMLPGHIAGHYARDDLMIDLVRLARFAGARVILDRAVGIDRAVGTVLLQDRGALRYDVASIDIGIGSGLPDVPGMADHAVAAKPLGRYAMAWEAFVAKGLAFPRVVIIGAGVGGVELALASAHRLRVAGAKAQITVVDRGTVALPGVGRGARAALLRQAAGMGVRIVTAAAPVSVAADAVVLSSGEVLGSDFTLSVAGAQPQEWLADTGLELHKGFVTVSPTLQTSDPAIFAAGDAAHMAYAPRPKAGVFAVRQAPVLHHNLRAALSGGAMRRYRPQRDYLKLISTGAKGAVADKFGLRLGGGWLWGVKDRIDRAFMAKFFDYPAMKMPALPAETALGLIAAMGNKPLCGGCGAKVGAGALVGTLSSLPLPLRPEVLSGPGDDAAILATPTGVQVLTTDHLRSFTPDAALMARIAAVHALGDVWAMGATPQVALAQITLPRLSGPLQADMLAQVMQAATAVFSHAGADVVGGHTSIGDELTIGFTVTGVATRPITKSGARPGDALILTKPLGSGTILAAEMHMARIPGLLMGEVWAGCIATMQRPLGRAAAILAPHAHAMTDVTGFGLAGHLLEIMEASDTAAILTLAEIPLMLGAVELAAAGYASSLALDNREGVDWRMTGPEAPLMYDPQTAGGLLASVPADQAERLLAALLSAGETAAIIGTVTQGPAHMTLT